MPKTSTDKAAALLQKIEKAKQDLNKLKEKRKMEIGELAVKAGLADVDNKRLTSAFEELAKKLTASNKAIK